MSITQKMAEESAEQIERAASLLGRGRPIEPDPLMELRLYRAARALRAYVPMREALEAEHGLPVGFEDIS